MSEKVTLFDAARASMAIIRARWADDHTAAADVLATMSQAELLDAVWSMSGLLEAALSLPPNTPREAFVTAILEGIDNSEKEQMK